MGLGSILRRLIPLALAATALWLPAQSFDLGHGREAVVSLNGLWRFHPGDSPFADGTPAWAQPGLNDSNWPLLSGGKSWTEQGYRNMSGFAWYRFQIAIPAGEGPVSLLLRPIITSYQVYVDGRLVGGLGKMPPVLIPSTEFSDQVFPLTTVASSAPRVVHVAIRVWQMPIWASYVGGGPQSPGSLAGNPQLMRVEQEHHQIARDIRFVDYYSYSIAAALIGLAILCLFFIRPGEREYLWFAVMLLAQAADSALNVSKEIYGIPPIPVFDLLDGILVALNMYAALRFFSRVLDARIGRTGQICIALLAVSPVTGVLYMTGWYSVPAAAATQLACQLPAIVWIFRVLVARAMRGNLDARLLLLPTMLDIGFYAADNLAILLYQAGFTRLPRVLDVRLPLPPFTMQTGILLHFIFVLAMLVFLIRRFTLARQREERLAGEFEAARQIQQVLLPDALDQVPGFAVEYIYQPAEQVGGDFFQQMADGRGGMLLVLGDVSGKGLPAAMMVSVLVGAIRAEADHGTDPATLLNSLNQRMLGRLQGGFTTCLAAHISAEGLVTLANAGHLPPYLNGEETAVCGSLPLGLVEQARYDSSTLQLLPGDRLTFVSDGVVEAQSHAGELLGFDRTRAMSREPATQIAQAAHAFGQVDDITVVTVEFSGVAVPANA